MRQSRLAVALSCCAMAGGCNTLLDLDRFDSGADTMAGTSSAGGAGRGTGGAGGEPVSMFSPLAEGLDSPAHLSAGDGFVYYATSPDVTLNEPVMRIATTDLTPGDQPMPQLVFDGDVGGTNQPPSNRPVQAILALEIGVAFYRGDQMSEDRLVYIEQPGSMANEGFLVGARAPMLFARGGGELLGVHRSNGGAQSAAVAIRWNTTFTTVPSCTLPAPDGFQEAAATNEHLYVSRPARIDRIDLATTFTGTCSGVTTFDDAQQPSLLRYDEATGHLVWATPAGVFRKHRDDQESTAAVQVAASTTTTRDLTVFDGRVYWLTGDDRVLGTDIEGGDTVSELAQLSQVTSEIEANANGLYVLQPTIGAILWTPLPAND